MSKTKSCSECGEEIQAVAIKCRFCGAALDRQALEAEREKDTLSPPTPAATGVSCVWVLLCVAGSFLPAAFLGAEGFWGIKHWPPPVWLSLAVAVVGAVLIAWNALRKHPK
jgi:hypothetical protein